MESTQTNALRIILCATKTDFALADAWKRHCSEIQCVSLYRGSILDLSVDAVVSPANSFGFMDGGIDNIYSHHFGWGLQDRLQIAIRDRHHGELLVGCAEIVETGNSRIPFLISAPTMRVPMILRDSVNPYLAARASLLLASRGVFSFGSLIGKPVNSVVNTVAFPGLGTGVGRISPDACARQLRAAIDCVLMGTCKFPQSWEDAQSRHQILYGGTPRDIQF